MNRKILPFKIRKVHVSADNYQGEILNFIKVFCLPLLKFRNKTRTSHLAKESPVVKRSFALFYHTVYDSAFRKNLNVGINISWRLKLLTYKVRCEENLKINSVSLKREIILFWFILDNFWKNVKLLHKYMASPAVQIVWLIKWILSENQHWLLFSSCKYVQYKWKWKKYFSDI